MDGKLAKQEIYKNSESLDDEYIQEKKLSPAYDNDVSLLLHIYNSFSFYFSEFI